MMKCIAMIAVAAVAGSAVAGVHTFPSSGSAVVGSVGFISPTEVGFFWSATRGDSVQETLADTLPIVNQVKLDLVVPRNSLASGLSLTWGVELNGTDIGTFAVASGQTGPISHTFDFAGIASPGSYMLRIEARNTIPGGGGSHTFAAVDRTTATLLPAPGAAALLGLGGLVAARRRRV
ncbi:MAG: hypothetical protein IT436_08315 [Phycisphaerales bacterium]|nr:hypothetical protein [Phycisphaerales bacterium]